MPTDPIILLSFINTNLRDNYESLDDLCSTFGADKEEIVEKLKSVGYIYDKDSNSFR